MKIDMTTHIKSPGLWARKIWEGLFRESHAENFESLDSFLCDLTIFKKGIEEGHREFWWSYSKTGYTQVNYFNPCWGEVIKITLSDNEILLEGETP